MPRAKGQGRPQMLKQRKSQTKNKFGAKKKDFNFVFFIFFFRLALYVYEYLLHVGAQKAAQTFLNEVITENLDYS